MLSKPFSVTDFSAFSVFFPGRICSAWNQFVALVLKKMDEKSD